MAFSPKAWKNDAAGGTKLNAAALKDLETRLSDYSDSAAATKQPLDGDLTEIAALATASYGRSLLTQASAAAARTKLEVESLVFNVKATAYGAKGDSSTDDSTAIQSAITAADAAGGGIVYFPAGTYIVGTKLTFGSNIRFKGAGWAVSIIKAKNASDIVVFEDKNYATTGVSGGAFEYLAVDGNKANNTTTHGIKLQAQSWYFHEVLVRDCDGHGFNIKLTTETAKETLGLDNTFISCRAVNCEDRGFNIEAHDTSLIDCNAIQCKEYGFYWTVNGYAYNCHSWCYDSSIATATKTGWRLATSVHCVNCVAEGATERQVLIAGNVITWLSGEVFNGTSKPNAALFDFNGGTTARILDPWCHEFGTGGAFKFTTSGEGSTIRATCFDAGGNQITQGTPSETIKWDVSKGGSTTLGNAAEFRRQQLTLQKFSGTPINNSFVVNESSGLLEFRDNNGTTRKVGTPSEEEIASAATITPSARISVAKITGTTEITKINATFAGHRIDIRFTGTITVKSAENLELLMNMQAVSGNTLSLICDGTKWWEIARQQGANGGIVASAGTITIPLKSRLVKISGATEVKKVEPTYAGHSVSFVLTETAKFADGENLKLSAAGPVTADDTITMICDGTNWFETGRAVN